MGLIMWRNVYISDIPEGRRRVNGIRGKDRVGHDLPTLSESEGDDMTS